MGEAARKALLRTTTASQRFDRGLELSSAMIEAIFQKIEAPEDATPEERARLRYQALREAGAR